MKKVYKIYHCISEGKNASDVTVWSSAPDFNTEKEAEDYLLKNIKPQEDYAQYFFIAPTYKYLPLES